MDEIEAWLRDHGEELSAIGRHTQVGAGMIHLLTVLVLGGLEDDQIVAELHAHLVGEPGVDPLVGVPTAMRRIRELAEADA